LRRERLPGFVLSVGNITSGGTGKTPAVVMLAEWAKESGYRVAVLSRGFGGRHKGNVLAVSDGRQIKTGPHEAGDEPCLLAKKLPGVPVVISHKRYLAGSFAREKFGCDFFILDDGFQHLELERDLDLALIDADSPFGNGHLLPWGPLRETVDQLARADAFIFTRATKLTAGSETIKFLKARFPKMPVAFGNHLPDRVVFPTLNKIHDPGFLKGKRVVAFAGIARPEKFRETVSSLGADVAYFRRFNDHYRFNREDLRVLSEMKEGCNAHILLTTEKDWIRLALFAHDCSDIAYLSIRFAFVSKGEQIFELIMNRKKDRRKSM
jgi:tetraacyldisaccharide 4'-kinase